MLTTRSAFFFCILASKIQFCAIRKWPFLPWSGSFPTHFLSQVGIPKSDKNLQLTIFVAPNLHILREISVKSADLETKTGYWWHGVDLGVTDPGKAPMHWVMAPPDMLPIEEYMEPGPGDIDPPIPWWGELRGCIDGLELRELVNQALFPLVVKLTWPRIWRSSSCCLLRRSCRSSWRSSTSGTWPTAWSSWKWQN